MRFGEGRRPESALQVQVAEFDGPLALLLSLIEARQLDVLTVPLGGLAEAYLDALATLDADRLGNVSAFVAVASQLILIKSRAMLPRRPVLDPTALPDEGTDPEAELRARLLLYRAHRDAGLRLAEEALARIGLFRREPGAAHAAAIAGARPGDGPTLDPARLGPGPGAIWPSSRRRSTCRRSRWPGRSRSPNGRRSSGTPSGTPRRSSCRTCSRASATASSSPSRSWPCWS